MCRNAPEMFKPIKHFFDAVAVIVASVAARRRMLSREPGGIELPHLRPDSRHKQEGLSTGLRTFVRLLMRQDTAASQYGFRERGALQAYVLLALIFNLILRTPFKLFANAILRPPLRHENLLGCLHVSPSVLQYRLGDARRLVRQCHDREHR